MVPAGGNIHQILVSDAAAKKNISRIGYTNRGYAPHTGSYFIPGKGGFSLFSGSKYGAGIVDNRKETPVIPGFRQFPVF